MYKYLKVCVAGLLISFIGALPLGTLNITAFDIAASQNVNNAISFALAAVFVELVYVRLILWGSQKIVFEERFIYYVLPLAILLLLYLSISSFMNVGFGVSEMSTSSAAFPKITSPILLGILLSALNPLQIPFWLAWNKILIAKNTLQNNTISYSLYMFGIGSGTLVGLLIFIFAGNYIVANYGSYTTITSLILGVLYLGFSLYLLFVLYKKHLKLKIQ